MAEIMDRMQIDDTDRRILALLRENARTSNVELARRAGISRTTLQARIERMERARVIAGYTIRGGGEHERQAIRAHVMITTVPQLAIRSMAVSLPSPSRHGCSDARTLQPRRVWITTS